MSQSQAGFIDTKVSDEVRPIPLEDIHDPDSLDFARLQQTIAAAVAALPSDAPAAVMAMAGNKGYQFGALVKVNDQFSFEGWLSKAPKEPLGWGVGCVWYPGRGR